ncbi:MAG: GntR family transcriptional regulator [Frankiales bacterium]|nr:GntR family transcriptional regulator [Frankiales bacterium]
MPMSRAVGADHETPRSRRRADTVRRIRDELRQELTALAGTTGILPDERLLALRLGASRNAVRDALNLLRDEGLVERRQGQGTRVIADGPLIGSGGAGLVNRLIDGRVRVRYEALWHYETPASDSIAAHLELAPGTTVMVLERLTSVDGVPTCLWTTYLRREDGLKAAAVSSQGDSYELLQTALGIPVRQVDLRIEAVLADESVTDLLEVRSGQPLLRFERLLLDADGRAIAIGFGRATGHRMAMLMSSQRPIQPAGDQDPQPWKEH